MLWFLIFIPIILGYSTQLICKLDKNTGSAVKFRPPSIVFSIVWPILYILLGISWMISMNNTKMLWLTMMLYIVLNLMLYSWVIVYCKFKSKKGAVWVLVSSIALSLACFTQGNNISKLLLTPLIAWLIFALHMNIADINSSI